MSNKNEAAVAWLKTVINNHVGAKIRKYSHSLWTGDVRRNGLGYVAFLDPIEGKVVDISEDFVLTKLSANKFNVTACDAFTELPVVGDKVRLTFYQLRRFDGTRADGRDDPAVDGCRTFILGGAKTKFPVEATNPYLKDLLTQLTDLPAGDGFRRVANILVDAGASDLQLVDNPENVFDPAPEISCAVKSAKFEGRVAIRYHRAGDVYSVELTKDGRQVKLYEDVYFDMMNTILLDAIDDGSWSKVKCTVIAMAKKPKSSVMGKEAA